MLIFRNAIYIYIPNAGIGLGFAGVESTAVFTEDFEQ